MVNKYDYNLRSLEAPQLLRLAELEERVGAILEQVEAHLGEGEYLGVAEALAHPHIPQALRDFRNFFQAYNEYFQDQVYEERIYGVTAEHVLKSALSKTMQTWEMLSRAINQRCNHIYARQLKAADTYAGALLTRISAPLIGVEPGGQKPPIIYFEKVFHITRFLHRTHPLLAVPLDRSHLIFEQRDEEDPLAQDKRWGAIAHELGHYLFWNSGTLPETHERLATLHHKIADRIVGKSERTLDAHHLTELQKEINRKVAAIHTWHQWTEETFADVFGTLLLGPIYAKSAQDLTVREMIGDVKDLIRNDGEHPMPVLRPLIAIETLKMMAAQAKQEEDVTLAETLYQFSEQLAERWQVHLHAAMTYEEEMDDEMLDPHIPLEHGHGHGHGHGHDHHKISPKELSNYIQPVLDVILNEPFYRDDECGENRSLLECVTFWGQNETTRQLIEPMMQELVRDSILPPPPGLSSRSLDDEDTLSTPATTSLLHQLFADVEHLRQKAQAEGKEMAGEQWQTLLNMHLALNAYHFFGRSRRGHAAHLHYIRHYHVGNEIVLV